MKKIVLIGGAGFIGHNLAIYLKSKEHNVTIIDSFSVNNLINFNDSDIENKSLYRSILNNRINIIEKNDINLLVEDARNYHQLSKNYNHQGQDSFSFQVKCS
jgi:nucleoside-diphosphate-sugar epimerase